MIGAKVGHLVVKRQLGEGGMGAVYLAEHEVMRTKHAVKVLLPQWTQNAMIVQRFINEAIAAASISHRNIIGVRDCGQLPDGAWYIAMDYLEGGTLGGFCRSQAGPLSMHLALQILAPVANGLETAHNAGLVHRDLKPDNIFLIQHRSNPHHPVILDWGIAKLGEHDGGAITRTGMMAGTPAYMAPEQMRDLRLVDRRSDVYALGLIAYQLVTGGWFPYQRKDSPDDYADMTAAAIYHLQMTEAPIDPREHFSGVSEPWANAILAAIHRDPSRRPQTARAFALMLAEATPGDAHLQSGTDIVRAYADELLEIGNLLETVRGPKPVVKETPSGAASRYHLGDRIGVGGMAEVFRATVTGAEGFSRPVAVKRVLSGFSAVPQFASMFVQEAQIASQLSHPNVVSVLDFDRDAEGRLFLAMEYVEGRDLARLAETGLLPHSTIIFVISEALRGLGYAHELPAGDGPRGVIHRDVSPQNVLLSWEGAVKVSDFGIAKAREASAATASTLIKGKPPYMSPEQANGEELDGRSDLFAVGVILWELLTGQRLFDGSNRETIAQVLFRPIPRPSSVRPGIAPDLEAVTMRLLERDRSARHANAELAVEDLARSRDAPRNGRSELARLLVERFPQAVAERTSRSQPGSSALQSGGPASGKVTMRDPVPPAAATPGTTLGSAAGPAVRRPGRAWHRRHWIAAGAAVALVATAAVIIATRGSGAGPATMTPSPSTAGRETPPAISMSVTTDPPGALVRLDGATQGTAPITVSVARGRRVVIEAEHDGFESARQVVTADREPQPVALTLRAVRASAQVEAATSVPVDAAKPGAAPPRADRVERSGAGSRQIKPKPESAGSGGFNPNEVVGD